MQLRAQLGCVVRALTLAVFTVLSCVPWTTRADDGVRAGVTWFQEPAENTPLTVIHPQVTYSQDYTAHFGLDAGYDADIVTGATPKAFGVDVVTAATEFDDTRHHGALGLRFFNDTASLGVSGGYAGESDYRSGTISVGASADLFNRNTQIGVEYTHNFDSVCDFDNAQNQEILELRALDSSENCFSSGADVTTRDLNIDSAEIFVTQVLTPWLLIQVGASGQILQGFQGNPYRRVQLGFRAVQERHPETRNRVAAFARAKFALKPIRGSIEMDARFYADSWAVEAFTGGIAWDQYLARPLMLRVRARWHVQDSAVFYRDGPAYASGGPIGEFWTGDRELSALLNTTVGAKLTYMWRARQKPFLKFIDMLYVAAKVDTMYYRSLTEDPGNSPNAERTDGVLDALIVQAQVGLEF